MRRTDHSDRKLLSQKGRMAMEEFSRTGVDWM